MSSNKKCNICYLDKNVSEYHKNGKGYHPICKVCRSIERKKISYERQLEGTKMCNSCNKDLDVYYFCSDKSNSSGLQTYCKSCQTLKTKSCTSTLNGFIKKLFKDIQHNAKKRAKELEINITVDDIFELYYKQEGKCALSGLTLTHETYNNKEREHIINKMNISVDRIDSNIGYNKDNIQLVCAIINRMKTDLPDNDFINLCNIISDYNKA